MTSSTPELSICVATRNRPDDLVRCLNSFALLDKLEFEIIVIDDASDGPIADCVKSSINPALLPKIEIFRHEQNQGVPATRNELARRSRAPYLLCLDDDAQLLKAESVYAALRVLQTQPQVGAVALPQTDANGALLPGQPTSADYSCYAPTFIGYGSVLRRDLFVELGGYREVFAAYYEEPEFCKRMLDRGFYVVYLPDAGVIHYHSPIGRNEFIAIRNGCRNKCFAAIYNEPLAMMLLSVPARLLIYAYQHQKYTQQQGANEFGVRWMIQEIWINLPKLWRDRKALKWATYYKWHKIKQEQAAYEPAN